MDSLKIEPTEDSPSVLFDISANRFVISGESRPENASKFYAPVINWLVEFEGVLYWRKNEMEEQPLLVFVFLMDYFNSTSAKSIMDILLILKKFIAEGYPVKIEWHYDKQDEDMFETGKEFATTVGLKFDLIED